jgi:hypothetical protein
MNVKLIANPDHRKPHNRDGFVIVDADTGRDLTRHVRGFTLTVAAGELTRLAIDIVMPELLVSATLPADLVTTGPDGRRYRLVPVDKPLDVLDV